MFNSKLQKNKMLVVSVLLLGLSIFNFNIGATNAFFSRTENSKDKTFTAGTLNFNLNPSTDFISSALLTGDSSAPYTTTLVNDGTLDFQYTVEVIDMGGDSDLCNYLTLEANNGAYTYNDLLSNFSAPARNYDSSAWNFVVTLPNEASDSLQDKTCNFKFTFSGWQKGLLDTQGFSDKKEINATISSGHWVTTPPVNDGVVLNEILAHPDNNAAHPANREFVELKNNGDISVDVAGWKISEMSGNTERKYTIKTSGGSNSAAPYGGSTVIPANGLLVLFLSDSSAFDNNGDIIRLYNSSDFKLDEYSYGKTTKGKSDARIPDGTGPWVDPIPTPGEPNKIEEDKTEEDSTPEIAIIKDPEPAIVVLEEPVIKEPEIVVPPPPKTEPDPEVIPESVVNPEPIIKQSDPTPTEEVSVSDTPQNP